MRKELDHTVFAGGEVDPLTGKVVKYKETTTVLDDDRESGPMPSMFGGLRSNPLFGNRSAGFQGFELEDGSDSDFTDDSEDESVLSAGAMDELLDDLSDFEMFEQEMLAEGGPGEPSDQPKPFFSGGLPDLDDLSDFEDLGNDEDPEPYLRISDDSELSDDSDFSAHSSDEDFSDEMTVADPLDHLSQPPPKSILRQASDSSMVPGDRKVAFAEPGDAGVMLRRPGTERRRTRQAVESADFEAAMVVPEVQFEDVETMFSTRVEVPLEEDESSEEYDSEPEEDEDDVGELVGSHFNAVQSLWSTRETSK
jgi:hypothetical protein